MKRTGGFMARSGKYVHVVMTRLQAEKLGILKCGHCGHPRNNHFDFKPKLCAHDQSCPGYTPVVVLP